MLVTLRSVLQTHAAEEGRPEVLTGLSMLDRATIRWVHISESVDPTGLVHGGELILTTGLAIRSAETSTEAYFARLIELGVAGVAIELSDDLTQIPEGALSIAKRHNFPVVVFRRVVRFLEITEEVHRSIVAEQNADLQFSQRMHETLTALSLERAPVQTIIERASALSQSAIVLEDLSRHVLAYATYGTFDTGTLSNWNFRSRRAPMESETCWCGPEGWLTTPVGSRGNHWGRLVIPSPKGAPNVRRLSMLLERTAQALELGRFAERDQSALYFQAQNTLLQDLRGGSATNEEEVRRRGAALGLPVSDRYLPAVVHVPPQVTDDPVIVHQQRRRLLERTSAAARAAGLSVLVGTLQTNQAGIIVACSAGSEHTSLIRFATHLKSNRVSDENDLATLAVGPYSRLLSQAAANIGIAQHVASAAASMQGERAPYYTSADVRLKGLLTLLKDDPRVQAFVEAELGPLLLLEGQQGQELLRVLRDYLAAGGNKAKLARISHASRPTLYKHLARIESVLGVSLGDPDSILSLGVALHVHDLRIASDSSS